MIGFPKNKPFIPLLENPPYASPLPPLALFCQQSGHLHRRLPVLPNQTREAHDWMFWEHDGDCKALGKIGSEEWELCDLAHDRIDSIDLATQHPKILASEK